jgi:uncharacterized OB-fold protein
MYCSSCGVATSPGLSYCNHCGAKLSRGEGVKSSEVKPEVLIQTMGAVFVERFRTGAQRYRTHDARVRAYPRNSRKVIA